MAYNTTLLDLRRMLRAEVGQSLLPAQGANAQGQYDMALDRTQKELWEQYEWPHLLYTMDMPLAAAQRLYPYPTGMPYDAILRAYVLNGTDWQPLEFLIPLSCYSQYGGEAGQSWPPQRWQNVPTVTGGVTNPIGKVEIWPIPSGAGTLRFQGQAPVNSLVADTDRAVLDDNLITLFAAAEILAGQKAENAALKLQKANQFLRRVLANQGAMKRRIPILGGVGSMPGVPTPTPGIDYIPIGYPGTP